MLPKRPKALFNQNNVIFWKQFFMSTASQVKWAIMCQSDSFFKRRAARNVPALVWWCLKCFIKLPLKTSK